MSKYKNAWILKLALAQFGLPEDPGIVAKEPIPFPFSNKKMRDHFVRQRIYDAFDVNEKIDPRNPNPEPGMVSPTEE